MQKDPQHKSDQIREDNFLIVVDFAGTLFALGPDKNHIKDPFTPEDRIKAKLIKGAKELDPKGYKTNKPKPFQNGVNYGWTVIPSVADLLHDVQGINIIASSVANRPDQVTAQKAVCHDNHIEINHIMTKDAEGIINKGYRPSTIVVLGDTSSDVDLAANIAELSPDAHVICGFTPSGMEQHIKVQETMKKQHVFKEQYSNLEFVRGKNWRVVIRELRNRLGLPIKSQDLHEFKELRTQRKHFRTQKNHIKKQTLHAYLQKSR